uniref:D-galacturonate reductase-like n=1 Tax=Tanacetum cinerariifolium TaxID=118510 RepID=A0A6L2J4Z5_TANCI|nr:D-galacturonate reductase-like [Tanacetum cinerariifolium]
MNSTNASSSNPSKKIKLTTIPPRQLFVNISSDKDVTTTPYPATTSLSPTLPNAPSKTTSINQTSSSWENTSTSFQSKLLISPSFSNEQASLHLLNPLLDNISDVPPRPLNPQPLQRHTSLDITLSLSPTTPLDHIHDTPSPPSLLQPQPPIMGHPPLILQPLQSHPSLDITLFLSPITPLNHIHDTPSPSSPPKPQPPIMVERSDVVKTAGLEGIKVGYRHFDTAASYGTEIPVEEAISEALSSCLMKSRDEVFITTKLCNSTERELVLPALKQCR